MSEKENNCKVVVDKIHIKLAERYQGNHIIGVSHDEWNKTARNVPVILIASVIGYPVFVCQLIPAYSLKHSLLLEQIT